jgi:hypothetical protein
VLSPTETCAKQVGGDPPCASAASTHPTLGGPHPPHPRQGNSIPKLPPGQLPLHQPTAAPTPNLFPYVMSPHDTVSIITTSRFAQLSWGWRGHVRGTSMNTGATATGPGGEVGHFFPAFILPPQAFDGIGDRAAQDRPYDMLWSVIARPQVRENGTLGRPAAVQTGSIALAGGVAVTHCALARAGEELTDLPRVALAWRVAPHSRSTTLISPTMCRGSFRPESAQEQTTTPLRMLHILASRVSLRP